MDTPTTLFLGTCTKCGWAVNGAGVHVQRLKTLEPAFPGCTPLIVLGPEMDLFHPGCVPVAKSPGQCDCGAVDLTPKADGCRCEITHDPKPFFALVPPAGGCPRHGSLWTYGRPEDALCPIS